MPPAQWLAPDDPGNPFGVRLLDLMLLQGYLSTTTDPAAAALALSWGRSTGAELDAAPVLARPPVGCTLRYPAARALPDGLLFAPQAMEQKWVLAWRGGRLLAARSWTGAVEAVAEGRHEGDEVVLDRIHFSEAFLGITDRPVDVFDWLVRSHPLGQRIPLPVSAAGGLLLEQVPQTGFASFGDVLFCAAEEVPPPPPSRPLRADGEVIQAARTGDLTRLRAAVTAGADVDAPSAHAGFTALHLAVIRGDAALFEALLARGADPAARADGGNHALGLAVVHGAPSPLLEALAASGFDLAAPNDDGFTGLHAAAEVDRADVVPWLVARGLSLDARTRHGHAPLHVACGLGHLAAATALLDAGADPRAPSPTGTPLDVARAEGHAALVALLKSRGG